MLRQLSSLLALLTSSGLISVGHGAIGALMIQQGKMNGFSDTFLGLLVTVTYLGFIVGNYLFRWLMPRISYIRTFSVCAAAIATAILLLPLLPVEAAWVLLRLAHGLFFSTTVIICESWLNSSVDNQYRGKLHATYMTVNYIAYGGSQYILLLGGDNHFAAFSLIAMFIIMSLAPICLTRFPEPQFTSGGEGGSRLTILDAYRIAPLAYVAQFGNGFYIGAAWLFVRYAEFVTPDAATAATLAVVFFGSGFLLQLPIGWLADRVKDRRYIIAVVYFLSAALGLMIFFGDLFPLSALTIIVLLFGAVSAPGFSLCVAYGQDFAGKNRAAEYAGLLFQPYAFGAVIGPFAAGFLMDNISPAWLFLLITAVCAAIAVLAVTNYIMPRFIPVRQGSYQAVATSHNTPTIAHEEPLYNEYDVGPARPPDMDTAEDEIAGEDDPSADFVGPILPQGSDQLPDDFTGPSMPMDDDLADADDNDLTWRR